MKKNDGWWSYGIKFIQKKLNVLRRIVAQFRFVKWSEVIHVECHNSNPSLPVLSRIVVL
jgi:hypothetical protein